MPELLLELMSEEIPARMQKRASEDLRLLVSAGLKKQGLDFARAMAFATPRRLTLVVEDVTARSPDLSEERRNDSSGARPQPSAHEKITKSPLQGAVSGSIARALGGLHGRAE